AAARIVASGLADAAGSTSACFESPRRMQSNPNPTGAVRFGVVLARDQIPFRVFGVWRAGLPEFRLRAASARQPRSQTVANPADNPRARFAKGRIAAKAGL